MIWLAALLVLGRDPAPASACHYTHILIRYVSCRLSWSVSSVIHSICQRCYWFLRVFGLIIIGYIFATIISPNKSDKTKDMKVVGTDI